jgi:hypothetical protein
MGVASKLVLFAESPEVFGGENTVGLPNSKMLF